jgi:hypothetical protein
MERALVAESLEELVRWPLEPLLALADDNFVEWLLVCLLVGMNGHAADLNGG